MDILLIKPFEKVKNLMIFTYNISKIKKRASASDERFY